MRTKPPNAAAPAPKPNPRTKYNYGCDHYAQLYDIPRATIIKYHRKNYPLDDPKALYDKISAQTSNNRPPLHRLRELAEMHGKTKPPRPTPVDEVVSITVVQRETPPAPIDESLKGLHYEMARLKFETDEAYNAYRKEPDAILKGAHWKIWKEMLEQWGKLAKIAPDSERELGNLVKLSDVESVWSRTHKEVKTQLEVLPRRISTHPVFKSLDPVDVEQAVEGEAITIMKTLENGGWLEDKTDENS